MKQFKITDYFSVKEYAKRVGVTRQAIEKQIKNGTIKVIDVGFKWIHKSQLKKYKNKKINRGVK